MAFTYLDANISRYEVEDGGDLFIKTGRDRDPTSARSEREPTTLDQIERDILSIKTQGESLLSACHPFVGSSETRLDRWTTFARQVGARPIFKGKRGIEISP